MAEEMAFDKLGFIELQNSELMSIDGGTDTGLYTTGLFAVLGGAAVVLTGVAIVVTAPVSVPVLAVAAATCALGGFTAGAGAACMTASHYY